VTVRDRWWKGLVARQLHDRSCNHSTLPDLHFSICLVPRSTLCRRLAEPVGRRVPPWAIGCRSSWSDSGANVPVDGLRSWRRPRQRRRQAGAGRTAPAPAGSRDREGTGPNANREPRCSTDQLSTMRARSGRGRDGRRVYAGGRSRRLQWDVRRFALPLLLIGAESPLCKDHASYRSVQLERPKVGLGSAEDGLDWALSVLLAVPMAVRAGPARSQEPMASSSRTSSVLPWAILRRRGNVV
jgi:hypothetical protein